MQRLVQNKKDANSQKEWHTLQLHSQELRLDYSYSGRECRLNGSFGGSLDKGNVTLPHLRVLENNQTIHYDYIITMSSTGSIFGLIRKVEEETTYFPKLTDKNELIYYMQETAKGMSVIRHAIEKGEDNDYMFQGKKFTLKQKLEVLGSVARVNSGLMVLSELTKRAVSRRQNHIDVKEIPRLLEIHRLV